MADLDHSFDAPWSEKEQIRTAYLRGVADKFRARGLSEKLFYDGDTLEETIRLIFWLENHCIRPLKRESGRLCHHKIIAATQCAIMYEAPFRDTPEKFSAKYRRDGWWNTKIRSFNAEFSLHVAVEIMAAWLPKTEDRAAIKYLLEDQKLAEICRENKIWLRDLAMQVDKKNAQNYRLRFPFLLVSQLWAAIERLSLK